MDFDRLIRITDYAILTLVEKESEAIIMSKAKAIVMEHLKSISDDVTDEAEVLNRLYMLLRLEHSKERCNNEGTVSDDEVAEYFSKKKEKYME